MEAESETIFPFKVFMTPAAGRVLNENSAEPKARRMDLLPQLFSMLDIIISQRKKQEGGMILFSLVIENSRGRKHTLKLGGLAGCTPTGEPAITVLMPGEKVVLNLIDTPVKTLEDCVCFENKCKHYNGAIQDKEKPGWVHVCNAFPGEIPPGICRGMRSHAEPLPNQGNQISFERAHTFGEMEMFRKKKGSRNYFPTEKMRIGQFGQARKG